MNRRNFLERTGIIGAFCFLPLSSSLLTKTKEKKKIYQKPKIVKLEIVSPTTIPKRGSLLRYIEEVFLTFDDGTRIGYKVEKRRFIDNGKTATAPAGSGTLYQNCNGLKGITYSMKKLETSYKTEYKFNNDLCVEYEPNKCIKIKFPKPSKNDIYRLSSSMWIKLGKRIWDIKPSSCKPYPMATCAEESANPHLWRGLI